MKIFYILLMAAAMAFTSCTNKPLDENNNGGETPKPQPELVIPEIEGTVKVGSVAEFLKKEVSDKVWYIIKGTVKKLEDNEYGNFFLTDETGEVYVWGVTTDDYSKGFEIREHNSKTFKSIGLKENDEVILVGVRKEHRGTQEIGGPTYYIKHQTPTPEVDPDHSDEGGEVVPPTPTPTPGTTTCKYLWAELPAMTDADNDGHHDIDDNIYYSQHWCAGGEKCGTGKDAHTARNFTACFSKKDHCPLWVAAPRHAMYVGGGRHDAYKPDPKIPADIQYYSKSTGAGCNKGHLLGSHERTKTTATNHQVFYYSNIAPQNGSTYNTGNGAWNNLEGVIDGFDCSDTLYQVVGCYFKDWTSKSGISAKAKKISYGGRNDVSWPTMMYIAVLRTKKGNTGKSVLDCSTDELKCAAFCISHNEAKGHKPNKSDMMSISELEKLTGFSYFVNVPNAPKDTFDPKDWGIR